MRGPYGTNPDDTWLSEGSPVQQLLDAEGEGMKLVHWIDPADGQEKIYVTANEELIEEARQGTERFIAERGQVGYEAALATFWGQVAASARGRSELN